jgi:hypothetical protein
MEGAMETTTTSSGKSVTRLVCVAMLVFLLFAALSACSLLGEEGGGDDTLRSTEIALAAQQAALQEQQNKMNMQSTIQALQATQQFQSIQATATAAAAVPPTAVPVQEQAPPTPLPPQDTPVAPPTPEPPTAAPVDQPTATVLSNCGLPDMNGEWKGKINLKELIPSTGISLKVEQTDCSIQGGYNLLSPVSFSCFPGSAWPYRTTCNFNSNGSFYGTVGKDAVKLGLKMQYSSGYHTKDLLCNAVLKLSDGKLSGDITSCNGGRLTLERVP